MSELTRCQKCRSHYAIPERGDTGLKVKQACNKEMPQLGTEDPCDEFKSRYVEYPLTIEGIENRFNEDGMRSLHECGKLVRITPCGEEYNHKTYLGILLGDLPIEAHVSYHEDTKKLEIIPLTNPGIFVPELRKIIYGMESWWGEIKSPEDLKDITSEEIDNQWFIQLLKGMYNQDDTQPKEKEEHEQ